MNKTNYKALLESPLWLQRRGVILTRDKNVCRHCSNRKYREVDFIVTTFFRPPHFHSGQQWIQLKGVQVNVTHNAALQRALQAKQDTGKRRVFNNGINRGFASYKLIKDNQNNIFCEIYAAFSLDTDEMNKITDTWDNAIQMLPNTSDESLVWHYVKRLNVHHEYYQEGKRPWEYPDEALTTLCWSCHEELHKNIKVQVRDRDNKYIGSYTPCTRCHGSGIKPEFMHVQNGICFGCWGAGYQELIQSALPFH